jgi:hypothetical protein
MMLAQSFILMVIAMVNALFLAVPPLLIYSLIRFEGFRAWVRESIENGDQVAHTRDAKNAVILFFAFVLGWINVDVMLGMLLFKQDWLAHFGAVTALFLALLGLSQWQGGNSKN